ncbi:MAG: hypothetical protein ACRDAG_05005 [Cetobacterium somerae]|uniref:Uncharacterized protein n=2 Tax=Cetobacterium TaxID=180162 RepID=U7VC78_9FUSO|nr:MULTISPECIES: hypothetical protein [Cetobacterium]ERT69317.1 hypothetical protein HMPREF0202_00826 [Cetobacterium somerae ATCC BAA-474]MBC2854356.1 hypothetical protein [Cetobacterium sp. 2G large]MCQ9626014.1 hypothetical protein [Cetobacterium somerae]WVJ02674.1 hypothetical protein VSU16_11330 [Cetobacterium somerae]
MSFLFKLFNNKNIKELEKINLTLSEKLQNLQKELEEKEVLISNYSSLQSKPNTDYSKQWQLMEKNLRNLQEENRMLKENFIKLNRIIPKQQWQYSFLVDLHYFYSANKFVSIREKLLESGVKYLQEINEEMFSTLLKEDRYVQEGLQKFLDYKKGIIDWDVKTFLMKGDKVTKIYQKSRKFLNILSEQNIEFMVDLESFDFQSLNEFGFSQEDIDAFKQKYESYNAERKI